MTAPGGLDLVDYKFTELPLGKICIDKEMRKQIWQRKDNLTLNDWNIKMPDLRSYF